MKDNLSISNIWRRLRAESPTFFKKVTWLCVTLGGVGGSLYALNAMYPAAFPSESIYIKISSHLIIIGIVGSFLSKLTVKDNRLS